MKRVYIILAASGLVGGTLFLFSTIRAADESDRVKEVAGQLELIERIESLERRVAKLESGGPLIRLATTKDVPLYLQRFEPQPMPLYQPTPLSPLPEPAKPKRATPVEADDENENINGVKWKIRMLGEKTTKPDKSERDRE